MSRLEIPGDTASIRADNAMADVTSALVLMGRGRLAEAARLFHRAQLELARAELELLDRARARTLSNVLPAREG